MNSLSGLRLIGVLFLLVLQACQPGHESVPPVVTANQTEHVDRVQDAGNARTNGIAFAELPPEAQQTLRDIRQGGPFAFDRDGVVFGNYEHRLPKHQRGYYHEYTVKTPGVRTRGTRRIISGASGEYYYSSDHYQTFISIRE